MKYKKPLKLFYLTIFLIIFLITGMYAADKFMANKNFSNDYSYYLKNNTFNLINSTNTLSSLINEAHKQNKIVLINFWAPWCAPCIKEIPELNNFYSKYKNNIEVIGIGVDNVSNINKFILKQNINFALIAADLKGLELSKIMGNTMGVLPYSIIIDNKFSIKHKYIGPLNMDELEKDILKIKP